MTGVFRYGDLLLACAVSACFVLWPGSDLLIARELYWLGGGFTEASGWVGLIYVGVARFWIAAPLLAVLLVLGYTRRGRFWRAHRTALAYLLLALLLGPGLVVNTVFKNNWGRPRPVHLAEFGRRATFTPALMPSDQCATNCSFPSGHAAAAFFPIAGYWLTRQRRWLVLGLGFGLLVGATRMAMGAHFLSDVLFAGLAVHFTCRALALAFRLGPAAGAAAAREDGLAGGAVISGAGPPKRSPAV